MTIIIILISISITIAIGFLVSFLWSLRSGQFDDTYSPSVRLLYDDAPTSGKKTKIQADKSDKSQVLK
ncbi:MAG TPA: cbb3-type cytochrome oxidase assembly protein CcoS [Chryseosolibacter sp.]